MMTSFSAHPKAENNNSKIFMCVFFAVGAVAIILSSFIERYTWVLGLVALASITTAILMYTKYVSVDFYYDVLADDEEPIFVVRQSVGKRSVTMCRVPLADIVSIKKETKEERKNHKRASGVSLFVYAPTMFPKTSYRIFVSNRYEKSEVVLEGSDEFFAKLDELARAAREMRTDSED